MQFKHLKSYSYRALLRWTQFFIPTNIPSTEPFLSVSILRANEGSNKRCESIESERKDQ